MYQNYNVYFICAFASIGKLTADTFLPRNKLYRTIPTDDHALGGGLFGFEQSSMSGVLGTYAYTSYFGVEGGYRQGGITSAMPGGSLVGALASSFVADWYSRKTAIQLAAVVWIIGSM